MDTLHLRLLTEREARDVYEQYLLKDFPPDEIKPWRQIQALLKKNQYLCVGLFAREALRGYAFFASIPSDGGLTDYLLDYFAVLSSYRDRGLGGAFLSLLGQYIPQAGLIIIEAENPDDDRFPQEKETRLRRLRFYLRNGVLDTGVTAQVWGVEFRLLIFGGQRKPEPDAIRALYSAFYHSFFPPEVYDSKALIR